jgi:DNA-3-methyladenine glycosylase II
VTIRAIPPFRLDFTVWALRRRPRDDIDRWDGTTYRRTVMIRTRVTELAIRQSGSSAGPRVTVTATPSLRA